MTPATYVSERVYILWTYGRQAESLASLMQPSRVERVFIR